MTSRKQEHDEQAEEGNMSHSHKAGKLKRGPAEKGRRAGYKRPGHWGSMTIGKGRTKPFSKPKRMGKVPSMKTS